MSAPRPVVVVDVETTGLDPATDHIWEVTAIRVNPDGSMIGMTAAVEHDRGRAALLPDSFRAQHDEVFATLPFIDNNKVRKELMDPDFFGGGTVTLVGACPWFDAAFLRKFLGLLVDPWHHRLRCVESMTAGHLGYDVGGLNDCIAALGLDANEMPHRSESDAWAAARIWQHLTEKGQA